jgi:hypothetical protein
MHLDLNERCKGPIEGLRLPLYVWGVLRKANITTIDELRAVADRLQRFEGIGPKTARVIREELARGATADKQPPAKSESSTG